MNALELLRDCTINKRGVYVEEENIVLTNEDGTLVKFPKSIETTFRAKNQKKLYDLHAVYICLKYHDITFAEYLAECRNQKATMVSTVDKKELIAYLQGKIDKSLQITTAETLDGSVGNESPSKKRRHDENATPMDPLLQSSMHNNEISVVSTSGMDKPETGESKSQLVVEKLIDPAMIMKKIFARERNMVNRATVLQSKTKETEYKLCEKIDREMKYDRSKGSNNRIVAPIMKQYQVVPVKPFEPPIKQLKLPGNPIIVVPAGYTPIFTILNIQDFLENGQYVSIAEKRKANAKKEFVVKVKHKEKDGSITEFDVIDNVMKLKSSEWSRVVAVFVAGPKWQFKDWKYKFPLELFKNVFGVYPHFHDAQIDGTEVINWNVHRMCIHQDKRHLDNVVVSEFWNNLDAFLLHKIK